MPRRDYYQQVPTIPNIAHLASELFPYLTEALPDIATDLTSKSIEATASVAARSMKSIGASLSRKIRRARASSKAYASFEESWFGATTPTQREKSIRILLKEEPSFAASLDMLLLRRDFVIATASCCNRFPALDQDRILSDDYVPIAIRSLTGTMFSALSFAPSDITVEGNHIIEGDGGSGKSTFLRHLAWTETQALLEDRHEVAFDDLRLPCWIRATDLAGSADIATALHCAATANLGARLRRPLPSDFFVADTTHGHRNWLIFVDGLDEVESRQRREVWDTIRLHAEQDSSFRFIVASRPETIVSISADSGFSRWAVEPVDSARQAIFAANYISELALRDRFVELLAQQEHQFIRGVPLFLAMSAQLFGKTGELHKRKVDLYEHYVTNALEKATGADAGKMASLSEVLCIIAGNEITVAELVRRHNSLVQALTGSFSVFSAEDALGTLLDRTALVRCSSNKCTFSHDLFSSYYRALDFARQYRPSPDVLRKIEPFREGWAVMEQLLLRWDRDAQNIESVLRLLLEYGSAGLQCASHVIAAVRRPEHSKIAVSVAKRLLTEAKDSGPTITTHRILAMLAEVNIAVRHLLIGELDSTVFISDTFIAECLLDAGARDEPLHHLLWLAQRHDGYSPDKVAAAEILLKYHYRGEALEALRDVVLSTDEDWTRVDAASILYEQERTPENRLLLADLCAINDNVAPDWIFSSTLTRLMEMGETELALPHLNVTSQLPDGTLDHWSNLRAAIEAARSIANHQDRLAGKQALERLLPSCKSMRENAEVACAFTDLGFYQEARSVLRFSLDTTNREIDWFTVDQLVRLDMTHEARSAVEATVAHLLDKNPAVYKVVELLEHALPLLDGKAICAFVLSRARSLKEPRLARCVALLGAPEDARSLLSGFLTNEDVSLCIRAASVLCQLGEARLGRNKLQAIVRNSAISAGDRMKAAGELKSVGLLRQAAIAFARITRDDSVEVSHRTRAALEFNELDHGQNYLVWDPLMAILEDRTRPVADRVDAAETLIFIDGDDGYDDIVYSELFSMLEEEALSDRDVLCVGAALGGRGWKLDEMPRVGRALSSNEINVLVKIEALQVIGSYGRNKEVVQPLIRIAADPSTSVELVLKAVSAIWHLDDNDDAQRLLGQISRNAALPPAWRLKATKQQRADLRTDSLRSLVRDDSIDISTRVEAVEALAVYAPLELEALLNGLANSLELNFWDRRRIAEAANRLKIPEVTRSVIQSIKNNRPLSVWEMVEFAKLCHELGNSADMDQILHELLSLPLVILTSSEDTEMVVEGIELAADLNRELATSRLEQMLLSDEIGWWSIVYVLEAYATMVGRDQALVVAAPIFNQLSAGLRDSVDEESSEWSLYAERLLKYGFYSDYGSLLEFAKNEGNRLSERARACILVMKYADAASSYHLVAQKVLSQLHRKKSSDAEKMEVVQALRRADDHLNMKEWLDLCLSSPPRDPEYRRSLAALLHDLGRTREARMLVEDMDSSELVKGFLSPMDKSLLKSVLEDDVENQIAFEQIIINDDPIDQIWQATDYVEEHGDLRALKIVLSAAEGSEDDPHLQLDAIECLNRLGFRAASEDLFAAMPKYGIEPYWFGTYLLRIGKKSEAVPFYIESSRAKVEYNEVLVLGGLADLGLVDELLDFRSRCSD